MAGKASTRESQRRGFALANWLRLRMRMRMRRDARGTCSRYQIELFLTPSYSSALVHLGSIPTVILEIDGRAVGPAWKPHAYLVPAILSSNEKINVVHTQRDEFAVRALQGHEQSTERSVHLAVDQLRQV